MKLVHRRINAVVNLQNTGTILFQDKLIIDFKILPFFITLKENRKITLNHLYVLWNSAIRNHCYSLELLLHFSHGSLCRLNLLL